MAARFWFARRWSAPCVAACDVASMVCAPTRRPCRSRIVGRSNKSRIAKLARKNRSSSAWTPRSCKEVPPRSKKFWSTSIVSRLKLATPEIGEGGFLGRGEIAVRRFLFRASARPDDSTARRSIFPVWVSGNSSTDLQTRRDHMRRQVLRRSRPERSLGNGSIAKRDDKSHEMLSVDPIGRRRRPRYRSAAGAGVARPRHAPGSIL